MEKGCYDESQASDSGNRPASSDEPRVPPIEFIRAIENIGNAKDKEQRNDISHPLSQVRY
ncbi:unnamed protein product [marine sediment metagenome]|uniref:Uncharacterized protein n=1 Tax=marine sediment metagenome TaxID=412755 RepID=X1SRT5_9ZZZZ